MLNKAEKMPQKKNKKKESASADTRITLLPNECSKLKRCQQECGKNRKMGMAHVSVMVYFTPAFRSYVSKAKSNKYTMNLWPDPVRHIKRQLAYSNLVLKGGSSIALRSRIVFVSFIGLSLNYV